MADIEIVRVGVRMVTVVLPEPGVTLAVRRYAGADRDAVRDIAWQTAFLGESAAAFFSDKELYADILTMYFTDYEAGSCFVAESDGRVAGYLIGSADTKDLDRVTASVIVPMLFCKAVARGVFLREVNLRFLWNVFLSAARGEFFSEDYSSEYPATLHINIRRGYRGEGAGSLLMERYLEFLRNKGVAGVRLATYSEKAGRFFSKHGFSLLSAKRRSYFRYLTGRDIGVYIYGRKLDSRVASGK
jgi:GNAT superfamily N-acetyltransferase